MTTTPNLRQNVPSPIQRRSSPSVSVFWLNVDQVRACLRQAVERLAQSHPEIEEVWLFGSLARGDAVPGSDADLLVVLSGSQEASWTGRCATSLISVALGWMCWHIPATRSHIWRPRETGF